MSKGKKVNQKTGESVKLRDLCLAAGLVDKRGLGSVAALAKKIGRNRVTVHRAWKYPEMFGPTRQLIKSFLGA